MMWISMQEPGVQSTGLSLPLMYGAAPGSTRESLTGGICHTLKMWLPVWR